MCPCSVLQVQVVFVPKARPNRRGQRAEAEEERERDFTAFIKPGGFLGRKKATREIPKPQPKPWIVRDPYCT